jgi:G:T-mismatch repair DNA endonuclease (very short patch repair protein)
MDKPTERALWNRIRTKFEQNGERAYRIEAANTPGFPDVVWVNRNGPVFVELKAGRFIVRVAQKKFVKDMGLLGVDVWIVWQKEARGEVTVWPAQFLIEDPLTAWHQPLDEWLYHQRKDKL